MNVPTVDTVARPFFSAVLVVLFAVVGLGGQAADPAQPPPTDKKAAPPVADKAEAKPATQGLEDLLATALKSNPDIKVAESKLREADAELNRARLQVTQKVTAAQRGLEQQRGTVELYRERAAWAERMAARKAISAEQLQKEKQNLADATAKLADLESELAYLLGKPRPAMLSDFHPTWIDLDNRVRLWASDDLSALHRWVANPRPADQAACQSCHQVDNAFWRLPTTPYLHTYYNALKHFNVRQPHGVTASLADKMRKALDARVAVDFQSTPLPEVLKFFQDRTAGVSVVSNLGDKARGQKVNLKLSEGPLGSVVQAVEDATGVRFLAREYGVFVTDAAQPPAGSVPLVEFWKNKPKEEAKTADDTARAAASADARKAEMDRLDKELARRSQLIVDLDRLILEKARARQDDPRAPDAEGTVKAVDAQAGLIHLSIGKDQGLVKGHKLDVYRLQPEPKYLGAVEILEVQATDSVAKPLGTPKEPIKVGDRAAGNLGRRR